MIEGGDDRPGRNRKQNMLWDICINKYTGRPCMKMQYINKTGAPSVYGELVKFDTATEGGLILTASQDPECIGAMYETGIADGSLCWIVIAGSVEVLLLNATAAAPGNWASTSTAAGRADCSNAAPVPARHWEEIGHCPFTANAGTDVLAEIHMHFN
jgi:hypothetical protein